MYEQLEAGEYIPAGFRVVIRDGKLYMLDCPEAEEIRRMRKAYPDKTVTAAQHSWQPTSIISQES